MSEYWKSTPKYWCKHCKTYVRDTKLEKQNHEATPKHQGNIKRFLRDLHRGHERDEREKQRAKDEVARLNGESPGHSLPGSGEPSRRRNTTSIPSASGTRQATPAERKHQIAELAKLGVAVPEDYRREVAMAGDWQVLSENIIHGISVKKEEDNETEGSNATTSVALNVGVRKRKLEAQDEEEDSEPVVRRGWGSTNRTYPGIIGDDDDLDALLSNTLPTRKITTQQEISLAGLDVSNPIQAQGANASESKASAVIKDEPVGLIESIPTTFDNITTEVKAEADPEVAGSMFKKRKAKNIRRV